MSHEIPHSHPLDRYHRRDPQRGGRSDDEVRRQWGSAAILPGLPADGIPAGSHQSVTIRYTVGSMGIDEDGGIKLAFRFVSDMGTLQADDPGADNYVAASTSGRADMEVQVDRKATVRPFQRTVFVHCRKATLAEGDTIDIVLGATTGGSRGWRQQTYVETPFPVRVAVDPLGTHDYRELPRDLGWDIVPGPLARWVVHGPSFAARGEPFTLRVKAEDAWGNPLRDLAQRRPILASSGDGAEIRVEDGIHERGVWRFAATADDEAAYAMIVDGPTPSVASPVVVRNATDLPDYTHYWCDLHGQTGETVGAGTLAGYFDFARHYAFLDGSVHQGNDFQITLELWERIKEAANAAYEPGRFVTFQGYEWSGTEAMGGDHNVLFHEDDPPMYRSTGWLDGHPFEEHAPLPKLYEALRKHEAMTIAHIGGRPAALTESDAEIEPLMEIHSAWGTFEWVYEEAFARGYRIGFVCNSDGHKMRPGASYPGAGIFGTLGGLTCVLSESHDRDGFWEALRRRRTYGTTGQRIVVDADLDGHPIGSDIVADRGRISARVVGTAPIGRLDLMRGAEVVQSHVPRVEAEPDTVVVRVGGARVKGRARMVRWSGRVTVEGNAFDAVTMNGVFSPAYGLREVGSDSADFEFVTTGNTVNLQLRLRHGVTGTLRFQSDQASFDVDLATLTSEPRREFAAPLDRRVELFTCAATHLPRAIDTSFDVVFDHDEDRPYFLRVTQIDEAKAWTSPFYVRRESRD